MLASGWKYSCCAFMFIVALAVALPAAAQDVNGLWQQIVQPAFDAAKYGSAENVTLARDRIRITFLDGKIQLSQPAAGVVFAAAFRGRGRVEYSPPNPIEAQQLLLHTGKATLAMDFTDAVFSFTDEAAAEISSQMKWASSDDGSLAGLYRSRQEEREDVGAEMVPRLFKSLLSADRKRTAWFIAELKTVDKGWVLFRQDALQAEEITIGRFTNWGGVTLFDTWQSYPAGNRPSQEAFQDPLAREDVHVRGYTIQATVDGSAELSATTVMNYETRAAGERVLLFELDSNLRVESIKLGDTPLTFFQPRDPRDRTQSYGDYVAVVLPAPTQASQAQALEFRYTGKRVVRRAGPGYFFCQSYGWYPTRPNSFAFRTDFDMTFRTPKKYVFLATGTKLDEQTEGDWLVTHWKSDIPMAVAGFAFGNYRVQKEKVGAVDVEVYANRDVDEIMNLIRQIGNPSTPRLDDPGERGMPIGNLEPARLAKNMAVELANTLKVFEHYFGPYPYKRLAITSLPTAYSYGQGWPTLIYLWALSFVDSTQRQALGITDHALLTDFFRAHESSHQWWGHHVGWKSYHDQWLSEGFAQFSGNLYVLFRNNEEEFLRRIREDKFDLRRADLRNRPYASLGPIWMGRRLASSDAPGGYSSVIYLKGGYVLHMLRMMMLDPRSPNPDARFIAMMHDFCRTFDNQPAATEDFKAIVEKHMVPAMDVEGNRRMDWFFRQYVYGTGLAQYQVRYQVDPTPDGKWKVTGTVVQFNVPPGWVDALPLYMQADKKVVRLGWVQATQPQTPLEFLLPVRPEKLILNYKDEILVDIK